VSSWLFALELLTALGCGLIGGAFFAFSTFVMRALARLPANEGIAAMQSINVVVLNAWFLGVFLGTAALCGLAVITACLRWHEPGSGYLVLGAASYLIGTLLVTIVCNVPRNDALAVVVPTAPDAASVWVDYVSSWTFWNHVRTIAALVASALFSIALAR
jgi:uncharacterized membrane protein